MAGPTKTAAAEYDAQGVRTNAVGPGFIDTPLLQSMEKQAYDDLVRLHPAGRLGRSEAVAEVIAFLLSGQASLVPGSHHLVDGGCTAP